MPTRPDIEAARELNAARAKAIASIVYCIYCGLARDEHLPDCLWRRAHEWVTHHPEAST